LAPFAPETLVHEQGIAGDEVQAMCEVARGSEQAGQVERGRGGEIVHQATAAIEITDLNGPRVPVQVIRGQELDQRGPITGGSDEQLAGRPWHPARCSRKT